MDAIQDVMQICRNGHVITDRLHADPESGSWHCERCGAATLDQCPTCGVQFPGALLGVELIPLGRGPAPRFCSHCGVPLPWVRSVRAGPETLATLETVLRRLPLAIRQLRWRQSDAPPFQVNTQPDLEDLLRAILQLHWDEVRLESRTPTYNSGNQTDFMLNEGAIAVAIKLLRSGFTEESLANQRSEDVDYYRRRGQCKTLVMFAYDPEGLVRDIAALESFVGDRASDLGVRCIVAR